MNSGKKKILFLLYSLDLGGVEKSFTSFLSEILHCSCDIHIGLVCPKGELLSLIPTNVKIHTINDISEHWDELKRSPLFVITNYFKTGLILRAIVAFFVYVCYKIWKHSSWWIQYILRNAKGINESFDIAIAYAGPAADLDYYLCHKIKSKEKYGWVHFDVSKFGVDKSIIKKLYKQYKYVFCCNGEAMKNILLQHEKIKAIFMEASWI